MPDQTIEPFMLDWTPSQISFFWDWAEKSPAYRDLYFSKIVGDSILREVQRTIPLSGLIADFGAGPGFMVEKLLRLNLDVAAIDSSPDSIDKIVQKFSTNPHFKGGWVNDNLNVPLRNGSVNCLFLVEVIEHLDNAALKEVLNEATRLLAPGGFIVITTPNEEDLPLHQILCPNCGCVYHTVQHIRSVSGPFLVSTLAEFGYKPIVWKPTLFSHRAEWVRPLQLLKRQVTHKKLPHLLYIGQKI